MPPLNQFLPKLATDSLKKANVHSTIDLLNADNTTLLHALQDEQIRESLLLFLIQDNHNNDQNASNIDSANVTTNTTTSTTTVTFNHEINNNNNNRVMANIPTSQTTASHASISPIKLVQLLKKYIITLCTSPGINAKELLKKQRSRFFIIKSGIKDIDKYLNGGIAAGTVTEINGRAGSGKTYFCLRIAANTLLDNAFANVSGVIFLLVPLVRGNDLNFPFCACLHQILALSTGHNNICFLLSHNISNHSASLIYFLSISFCSLFLINICILFITSILTRSLYLFIHLTIRTFAVCNLPDNVLFSKK
jgi:hypothetical protein